MIKSFIVTSYNAFDCFKHRDYRSYFEFLEVPLFYFIANATAPAKPAS